jgi:hypothetical protein
LKDPVVLNLAAEVDARYNRPDKPKLGPDREAQEIIAVAAERRITEGKMGRLLRKARELMRRALLAMGLKDAFSSTDLDILISEAGRRLTTGKFRRATRPEPAFSMPGDSPEVPRKQNRLVDSIRAGQPLDRVFRAPLWWGIDKDRNVFRPTERIYDKLAEVVNDTEFNPEGKMAWMNGFLQSARAGLIDRHGLPEEYRKRDMKRESDQRRVLLEAVDLIDDMKARGVDQSEARVLQAILVGEEIADADWQSISEPIRKAIDEMGQEAVLYGLISEATYQRHKGTYLHRVYEKHEDRSSGLGKFVNNAINQRRKSVVGNQLKGRGMDLRPISVPELLKNSPMNWWGRKLRVTKGDEALLGSKWTVFDRLEPTGEGTVALDEVGRQPKKQRVLERVYVPADQAVPAKYQGWTERGTWELRHYKGGKAVLWRDYTKAERTSMGEILDARYTIAKTYQLMAHDLASGKFFKDIAENENWARKQEPADWTEGSRGRLATYTDHEWVHVPTVAIPKTGGAKKWGALSGMYVRSEIWRDLVEQNQLQVPGAWRAFLTQWKLNKTARNPVVHMNNIMSNFLFMDLADIRLQDLIGGLMSYYKKDEHYRDAEEHGAFGASFVDQEIRKNVLEPVLKELMKQNKGEDNRFGAVGVFTRTLWEWVEKADTKAVDYYRLEDEIFRMATYMRRKALGDDIETAAHIAREQFLNYDIRAPWVNAARASFLPFIAYTYRAVPLIAKAIAQRPWKLAKYATVAYVANALGYMLMPGDEDEERRTLREEARGNIWLPGIPRMLRMPFRDHNGDPVFLDIRRWIPAGDVFDLNQANAAIPIPAPLQLSGPLMLAAEFAFNRVAFTGEEIVNRKTDTGVEATGKIMGWAWKSWMPSAPWIPGSWYWDKIGRAAGGGRDILGRDYSVPFALASSIGVKVSGHDVDLNRQWRERELQGIQRQLIQQQQQAGRDHARGILDDSGFAEAKATYRRKMQRLAERADELRGN